MFFFVCKVLVIATILISVVASAAYMEDQWIQRSHSEFEYHVVKFPQDSILNYITPNEANEMCKNQHDASLLMLRSKDKDFAWEYFRGNDHSYSELFLGLQKPRGESSWQWVIAQSEYVSWMSVGTSRGPPRVPLPYEMCAYVDLNTFRFDYHACDDKVHAWRRMVVCQRRKLNPKSCDDQPCFGGRCVDTLSSANESAESYYKCECSPGYEGNRCEITVNECLPSPCENGATCCERNDVGYDCRCPPGYVGKHCEIEINECDSTPCENNSTCTDVISDYQCACLNGSLGRNCEKDVVECRGDTCQNGGKCSDFIGYFECSCSDGYSGETCSDRVESTPLNSISVITLTIASILVSVVFLVLCCCICWVCRRKFESSSLKANKHGQKHAKEEKCLRVQIRTPIYKPQSTMMLITQPKSMETENNSLNEKLIALLYEAEE